MRWQIGFPFAAFIISSLYGIALWVIKDYDPLGEVMIMVVYPVVMMIYALIVLQWLLPKKGFQAA